MLNKTRKSAFMLMAGLAVVALAALPAAAGQLARAAAVPDLGLAPNTSWVDAPLAILYTQYDNPGAVAVSSQNFEAVYDIYDDVAADDLIVPANTKWTISGMAVQGAYFNPGDGPADSFNVLVYTDTAGKPGTLRVTRSNMNFTLNGTDQFRIKISPPINIPSSPSSRHLWFGVQANLDAGTGGQWGWTDRTVQCNSPAAWENPGGGFGVCPNWDVLDTCLAGLNDGDDLVFLVAGTASLTK